MSGMSRVELDEDDEPDRRGVPAPAGPPAAGSAPASQRSTTPVDRSTPVATGAQPPSPRTRRLRRATLVGVAALLLGLVGTQAAVDARERARLARFADVPGVLAPVDPDASTLWSADPRTDPLFASWAVPSTVGELVVGGATGDDGTFTLGALDPDTGTPLWTRTLPMPGGRQLPTAPYQGWIECVPGEHPPTATGQGSAVCTVQNPAADFTVSDGTASRGVSLGYTSILVVDTATGDLDEQVDLPLGTAATPVRGGYLTATPDVVPDPRWRRIVDVPSGGWTVRVTDWGATSPRWTFRVPPSPNAVISTPMAVVDETQVALTLDRTVWLLDAADGSVVKTFRDDQAEPMGTQLLPDGGALVSWFSGTGPLVDLRTADGTVTRLDGVAGLLPVPDDGSAPGVLFLAERNASWGDGPVVAVDARTGEELWRSTAPAGWSAALLDGVLYTVSGTDLNAIDVDDGTLLWTVDVDRSDGQLFVDGRAALVATESRIDAFDLRDGRPLWSSVAQRQDDEVALRPVTEEISAVAAPDGTAPPVSGWFATVGRRLALVDSAGALTVLG